MSQYFTTTTCFKDVDALIRAILEVGRPVENQFARSMEQPRTPLTRDDFEVHEQATILFDYRNRDSQRKAEIVMRRNKLGNLQNDLGFAKQADGTYNAEICDYAQRCGWDKTWLGRVSQRYAVLVLRKQAARKGLRVVETVGQNGAIKLQIGR